MKRSASELQSLASEIRSAQDEARQIEPFSSRFADFDLATGYAVGQLLHEAREAHGALPVGRKIGFTNPQMWEAYGVRDPIWGHVYLQTVVSLREAGGVCRISRFTEPKIEPEIVFHFRSAPPVTGDLRALLASIDWIAHGFEIVQSHFPGWKFAGADAVADNALHAALLLGDPIPVDRLGGDPLAALESFSVTLSRGGEVQESGRGANVLGSPLRALAHLAELVQREPSFLPLHAGEIVTTGTLTAARAIAPGETWETRLEGIGVHGLSVSFVG